MPSPAPSPSRGTTSEASSASTPPAPPALLHPLAAIIADPGRHLWRVAGALVALQFLIRFALAMRGWFVGDDFAFIGRAHEAATPNLDYLSLPYAGHVMPLSWLWIWVCVHAAPYAFWLPTLGSAIVQAITAVVVLRLLVVLFGTRWVVLAPFALFLFTALNLPAFVWWAAALNQSPQQLALAAALLNHAQYLRTGALRRGLLGALCLLGGLGFSEKSVLGAGLIFLITYAFFAPGLPWPRLRRTISAHWKVWAAYLLICGSYLGWYQAAVPSPVADSGPVASGVVSLAAYQIFNTLIPAALGGPWAWTPLGSNAALAAAPALAVQIATLVAIGLIGLSIARHHRAWFGWAVLGAYELVNLSLLAVSRAAIVGPAIGLEFRYATDLALVITVCASLACLQLAPDFASRGAQPLLPRASFAPWLQRFRDSDVWTVMPLPGLRSVIAATVLTICASALWSSWKYTDIFSPSIARPLMANVEQAARDLPPQARISDTPLDQSAVWNMVYPYSLPSRVFAPTDVRLRFLTVGEATPDLRVITKTGALAPVAIDGIAAAPGTEPNCGYRVTAAPRTIMLPSKTVVPWNWLVRVGYLSSGDGTTTVTAGGVTSTVQVQHGLGQFYLQVSGVVDSVHFGGLSNGAQICTDQVAVGTAVPAPGQP